jgi:hypothetical protein
LLKKRKHADSDEDEFASSNEVQSPEEDSEYIVGESQDGGDLVSSVREESLASSPSSEESSDREEAIILSDNEGMGVQ